MTTRALNDPALRVAATIADDFEGLSLVPLLGSGWLCNDWIWSLAES